MTICPIAVAVGCRKLPGFSVCPVKSVIGDVPEERRRRRPRQRARRSRKARSQMSGAGRFAPRLAWSRGRADPVSAGAGADSATIGWTRRTSRVLAAWSPP